MFKILDIAGGILIVVVIVLVIVLKRRKVKELDTKYYRREWNRIQKKCSDRKQWTKVLIEADDLLDDALKKKKVKGKTRGERIVSAQRLFTANDSVWYSHKLANRIRDEELNKVNKKDTIKALSSFRQALHDIGALPESKVKAKK